VTSHDHNHDEGAHGAEPIHGVDPAALHRVVDDLTTALHSYVDTAVGVRAEFGATEADEDPRILALEATVGSLNAKLYDLVHATLGLHADLTGMSWDDEEPEGPADEGDVDTFHLGFVVGPPQTASDLTLDSVLDMVDTGGADLARTLQEAGFDVIEWGAARGAPVHFGEDDVDELDEEDGEE
jgi:hypothetical protein